MVERNAFLDRPASNAQRRGGSCCWAMAVLLAALLAPAGPTSAQADDAGRWVLESVETNPDGDTQLPAGPVTVSGGRGSISFDFTDAPMVSIRANYTDPPAELMPGEVYPIDVQVDARLSGGTDTQGFRWMDVILLEDGVWRQSAGTVTAGQSCYDPVGALPIECTEPESNTGQLTFTAPWVYPDGTYSVGVVALNCGGTCLTRYTYRAVMPETPLQTVPETPPEIETAPGLTPDDADTAGSDAPATAAPPGAVASDEPSSDTTTVLVVAGALAVAAVGVHLARKRRPSGRVPHPADAAEQRREDEQQGTALYLDLTYPVGISPKVFTAGWLFGARCVAGSDANARDLSHTVRWSGTGTFYPSVGARSRPDFAREGTNSIVLSAEVDGQDFQRTYTVQAVAPYRFAAISDLAFCPSDAHGCPACPHAVQGPIISGSLTVMIGGKAAARAGDRGIHAACCGPNTYTIADGDPQVLIDGRRAARIGSPTQHCGGTGTVTSSAGGSVWRPHLGA